jgi:hypothetical protein
MLNLTRGYPGALDELGLEVPFTEGREAERPIDIGFSLGESPFAESGFEAFAETPVAFEGEAFPSGLVLETTTGPTGRDQEHWDPSNVGLPLLATGPSVQSQRLSPHFTVKELVSSGGKASPVARISPALVRVLEAIRERAGKTVQITSGYRSWARNKEVYAKRKQKPTDSRHCSGQAADINLGGMNGTELAKLAIDAAGADLALGIGADYIHVDVRGKWVLWTYFPRGGAADKAAKEAVEGHRKRVLRSRAPMPVRPTPTPTPTPPTPVPPRPGPATTNRLVVPRHPLLRSHRGTAPDLILRWNRIKRSGEVDVVVHFHGFSGQREGMRINIDKEPISGLNFTDPAAPGSPGRDRPTLGILPRGHYHGGDRGDVYHFPALIRPGALQALVEDSLARLSRETGHTLSQGRLILTGHSGGGAPVSAILAHTDPDEVHIFDGTYSPGANIVQWAEKRIGRELATPAALPPSMRILYRPGTKKHPGTQPHAEAIARSLCRPLGVAGAARLRPFFRADCTLADHNSIPRRFGWLLLANPAADLPGVTTYACAGGASGEAGEEPEASAFWESAANDREESQQEAIGMNEQQVYAAGEALAWLDVEAPYTEAEQFEPPMTEAEGFEPEALESEWSESETGEGPDGEELDSFEMLDEGEMFDEGEGFEEDEGFDQATSAEWLEDEEAEEEEEGEADELERFGEFGDQRDTEWETDESEGEDRYAEALAEATAFETELEGETSLGASGLTPAERKAVEITSTFETGKRGGFFGLSGNFDGQGLSFGLVNWTIGTESLQPLLRDFAAENPERWNAVFGPDADRFRQLISRKGKAAVKEQHSFAIKEMNSCSIRKGKPVWAIREPWFGYFKRLSEDPAFQAIQIRYVRKLLSRADHFCREYKLRSEQAFTFLFDAVSSHGKSWPNKKNRHQLVEQRLKALAARYGEGKVPESETLLAIADVLGTTSAQRWAQKARTRKRWFVTGEHPRARELADLRPRPDVPYSVSAPSAPAHQVPSPSARPSPARSSAALCNAIVRIAEQEYRRWHPPSGNLRETDSAAVPILQQYYREGLKRNISAAELQNTTWQQAHPWSAVFVSWVMRTAGAGTGFACSAAHQNYIRAARRNRLNGVTSSPFWAYRATEVAPQVGDLVCASRSNSGATYDNIADPQTRPTHCDIVTEVRPGSLRVIGGNVSQNVDAKKIRTQPDGRLALDGAQARFFAVLRCRGMLADQAPQPPAPTPAAPTPPAPTPPAPSGPRLTPARFVATFGSSARASQAAHGVPALVTLGQAALESGWGAHAPRFNFFGIKAKASDPEPTRQLLRTREVFRDPNRKFPEIISITPRADGKYDYVVRDWFRAYPDAATAFNAHGEFLVRNKRYAKAFMVAHDAYAFATEVARAGYATDPSYERVLHSVMRKIEAASGP